MENKKGAYGNPANTPTNEILANEAIPKHVHNTAPQHLRLLQYGLKIPNHQHTQVTNQQSLHHHLNRSVTPHLHQYQPQVVQYQQLSHLQHSPHQHHQFQLPLGVYQNQSQLSTPTSIHPQNHYHFQNVSQTLQPPNYLPLQPPSHYHQPQQQQPKIIETKPEPQTQPSQQVPKPKEIERSKKSGGNNNQQLRSPSAKRPLEAPITQQGWLYKQGSDGLMLWKKRWFILSEYCLFYYKSSEEEKLLGSILLPSYKVSICGPEDKVNRKFAFKCEHVNMRTYVLAADSHEVMTQWIKHLNMACLLQNTIEPDSSLSQITVELSNSTLESNLIRYPAQQLSRTTPIHIHSSSNTTDLSASSQNQELNQYPQPLYANAPPKPRRLNDGYLSPSSEILERHMNESKYIPVRQPQRPYNMQQVYMNQNSPKPPINVYGNPHMNVEYFQRDPHLQYINKHIHDSNMPSVNKKENQSIERRTPDTYGRSKLNQAEKINHPSDYEDIYSDQFAYKRPLSPMAYTNNNDRLFNPSMPRQYNPVNVVMRKDRHCINNTQTGIPPNTIPRPHSADFLEYEVKHQLPEIIARQPRPKSSLDINRRSPIDNYFYTEERYAEKMRRSAQYLPKMAKYSARDGNVYEQYEMNGRSKWNQNGSTSSKYNADAISKTDINNDLSLQDYHSIRSRSVLSDGSLSRELDIIENERNQYSNREKAAFLNPYGRNEYDQFTRSASARLSQSNGIDIQYDLRPTSHEGERKREESMKRLLEWKQRMLQSPLNRKVNRGLNNRNVSSGKYDGYNRPSENGYSQMPDEKNLNRVPQYSSYSSDDEEKEDASKENSVQTQAGRTTDTYPSISQPRIPALTTSTTAFNFLPIPVDELVVTSSPVTLHDKIALDTDNVSKLPVVCTETNERRHDSQIKIANDDILEKPLKIATCNSTHTALVSSLRSEFSNKFEKNTAVDELKSSLASVKAISSDSESKNVEENYMSMTSNKSILAPVSSTLGSVILNLLETPDENPYVEMTTKGLDSSVLDDSNGDNNNFNNNEINQAYEVICFSDGKAEPVYVELNQIKDVFSDIKLPDILVASKCDDNIGDKSDSSDADDEASKDVDSLDASYHPRFSLSDSFRPASYYLGANRVMSEFQDSSDSELVSPPPIPASSPPMDDIDHLDDRNNSTCDKKQFFNLSSLEHDTSSFYSINTENDPRSNNSDSDVELRAFVSRASDNDRLLKRRPVSEEFFDELLSSGSRDLIDDFIDERYDIINKNHDYENVHINHIHSRESSRDTMNKSNRSAVTTPNDFISRSHPDCNMSCLSINIDASSSSFLDARSPQLTPVVSQITGNIHEINSSTNSAPYYYSDLSINTSRTDSTSSILTLNNQRSALKGSNKRDITHIVNPIRCNNYQQININYSAGHQNLFDSRLAAEARSVSVDFLNIADKSDNIDKKNIYESDTLKRIKASDLSSSLQINLEDSRNLYSHNKSDKFGNDIFMGESARVRRSYSLEGLLENVLNENTSSSLRTPEENNEINMSAEGSYLWEEDSIWRERLRSASQRHTKSLDDLDCIGINKKKTKRPTKGISRLVTYVNDNMYNMLVQSNKQTDSEKEPTKCESSERSSFILDREKLRQWDFLSSAPSDAQFRQSSVEGCINSVVDLGAGMNACESSEQNAIQSSASGSISIATRDSFSRNVMPNKAWSSNVRRIQSKSTSNLSNRGYENDYIPQSPGYTLSQGPSQQDLSSDTSQSSIPRRPNNQMDDKMNVSAGELLGRTHEELVLLLIQLRRQSANTFNAIETYYNEIDNIQSRLPKMDASKRLENLQKLEQIKQHLLELEKQYEKGKPLVNLVDNMVKLGSLYKFPKDHTNQLYVKDRLEFNQQMQERRLLAEEKRDWNRLSPNHSELQNKVHQLYQLDQLIQEESETLQGLQQDKEKIEHALGGLRHRLIKGFKSPAEVEQARKQQIALESELSRVHSMLAQNSRKLEETVAGNARLEQELLVLKQKLQISRQHRSSPQISNAGDSLPCVIGTSAMLESDLHRVQQKVGDLQRQRQELSVQVKQLTDRSNNLQQSKLPPSQILSTNKKKIASSWRETDLDTMRKPLYINTVVNQDVDLSLHNNCNMDESSTNSLLPQEKQEIKTVRIVKRESERRQRDREKAVTGKWDAVTEEDDCSQNFTSQTKLSVNNIDCCSSGVLNPSNQNLSTNSANLEDNAEKSSELSPIFKSEAARQIIIEMSTNPQDSVTPKKSNRRLVPKEKRRHHTAPHNNLIMKSLNQLPTTDKDFEKLDMNIRRARDDLDMERALKQRIDTPDVVRSTLSTKDLKYNENTIDNILGTPNKILIPERYIPEQLPQLSAEEEQYRLRKVESIKKMLSDTAIGSLVNLNSDETTSESVSSTANNKSSSTKILEEKKQREHLLQLNQILAKQVMEMSKIVAGSNTHEDLQ